jgi:hypothetical protein
VAPPDKARIAFAVKALRDHSQDWETASDDLKWIVDQVGLLHLNRIEAGLFQHVVSSVNSTVKKLHDRCQEGSQETHKIREALLGIAKVYEDEEAQGVHRMKKLY